MRVNSRIDLLVMRRGRVGLLAFTTLAIAACGGGGGGKSSGPDNRPVNRVPTADAGPDQSVNELIVVQLNGMGSDPDKWNILRYTWTQTAGPTVVITGSDFRTASFTAPDVAAPAETLSFELTVSDGLLSATDTVDVTVNEPAVHVAMSGQVNYEFVPLTASCGLNFAGTIARPIRGATVQIVDAATQSVLASDVSDDAGNYQFPRVAGDSSVQLRVRAELKKTTGTSTWDVEVRDNFDDSGSPPPLEDRALYVVQWAPFDSGSTDLSGVDGVATTGWGGSNYTGDRAAAPFAILDTISEALRVIEAADSGVEVPPLDVYWSVNNLSGTRGSVDIGHLGTSFYRPTSDSLFLLGDERLDTEEFDRHVILHELGHFFEDTMGRMDSFGGPHMIGESLDARLAFSEGWASAFGMIVLEDPEYCDTKAADTSGGSRFNGEGSSPSSRGPPGWYNELNVLSLIYDLWDTRDDFTDTGSVGWPAIYDTMVGPQATTEAFTTLFTFATELRSSLNIDGQALIDSQLERYNVVSGVDLDIWGSNETNDRNIEEDVLPLYTDYIADGSILNICVTSILDRRDRHGNNIGEDRFLRIGVPVADEYDVQVVTTTPIAGTGRHEVSDPELLLYRAGDLLAKGGTGSANRETYRTPMLEAGRIHTAVVSEMRFHDDAAGTDFPERICFDLSLTPTP